MKHKRLSNVDSVKQITVIEVKSIKGVGTTEDPISQITEYFLPDGARLARVGLNDNFEEIHEWSTPQTKGEGKMKKYKTQYKERRINEIIGQLLNSLDVDQKWKVATNEVNSKRVFKILRNGLWKLL